MLLVNPLRASRLITPPQDILYMAWLRRTRLADTEENFADFCKWKNTPADQKERDLIYPETDRP